MRATLGGPRRPAPAAAPAGPSMVAIRCGLVERRNTAEERRKKTLYGCPRGPPMLP